MSEATKGPWRLAEYEGEENRVIIGAGNVLIADCFPASVEDYDIPEDYRSNAAMLGAALKMFETLKKVWIELNEIRARDGAPQHIDWDRGRPIQISSCSEEYFSSLVDEVEAVLAQARGRGL